MHGQTEKLRGRQTRLNLEWSFCLALLCMFFGFLILVVFMFLTSADANNLSLDEKAGVTPTLSSGDQESETSQAKSASAVSRSSSAVASAKSSEDDEQQGKGLRAVYSAGRGESGAVKFGSTEKASPTQIKFVDSLGKKRYITFSWEGLGKDNYKFLYNEEGSMCLVALPWQLSIRVGEKVNIYTGYEAGTTYYEMENNERVAKYVFLGWDISFPFKMPEHNIVIKGKWKYVKIESKGDDPSKKDDDPKLHNVTYLWDDPPLASSVGDFVDEDGNVVDVTLPASVSVEEGKTFLVDTTWQAGKKIYFRDAETKTLQRQYVFGGWDLLGEQTMQDSDVKISGAWTSSIITHNFKYAWHDEDGHVYPDEDVKLFKSDGTEVKAKLPEESSVASGITVQLCSDFEIDVYYEQRDDDGNVLCYWVFHGWDTPDATIVRNGETGKLEVTVGDSDIEIWGEWTRHSDKPEE